MVQSQSWCPILTQLSATHNPTFGTDQTIRCRSHEQLSFPTHGEHHLAQGGLYMHSTCIADHTIPGGQGLTLDHTRGQGGHICGIRVSASSDGGMQEPSTKPVIQTVGCKSHQPHTHLQTQNRFHWVPTSTIERSALHSNRLGLSSAPWWKASHGSI